MDSNDVQPVLAFRGADTFTHGIKSQEGYWMQRQDGSVICGTEREMLALFENLVKDVFTGSVQELPAST